MDLDIWAGLFFLLMGFRRLVEQPFDRRLRQSSPTAFQVRHGAQEAFRQPASAGP
jgi:hypothetical protein